MIKKRKTLRYVLITVVFVFWLTGCGSSRISEHPETANTEEPVVDLSETEEAETGSFDEGGNDTPENDEQTVKEPEKDPEPEENWDFPYGIDKMEPIMRAIGYRILEDDGYIPDTQWRTIGITLCMDYESNFGRGKYEVDENSGGVIVPADDVREFFAVLTPDFDGKLPEISDSYLASYDMDNDAYTFGLGDFAMDVPVCDGFKKTEEGYQALCGSEYYNDEGYTEKHENHGIVTLVHNDYSDTVENPLFIWRVSDVKVIVQEEYEKILPEFSRDELLPAAEAYANFLKDYKTDEYTGAEGICYNCGYVDEDDIPELFIVLDNSHNATIRVYGYKEGEVKDIGEFGSLGAGRYIPYKNILLDNYWGSGADYTTFLKIDDDSLRAFGYAETEPEDITNYDPDKLIYMIADDNTSDTRTVTKEEYEKAYEEYSGGNSAAAIEVTYSNSAFRQEKYEDILSRLKKMLYIN